jgi:hypothetical protein
MAGGALLLCLHAPEQCHSATETLVCVHVCVLGRGLMLEEEEKNTPQSQLSWALSSAGFMDTKDHFTVPLCRGEN